MKTTLDIDESLLRAAEAQARQQGKPLAVLFEEALRTKVMLGGMSQPIIKPAEPEQGLEDNDPFFAALDEIRNAGRQQVSHRAVHLE